jgi:hypothetical protein
VKTDGELGNAFGRDLIAQMKSSAMVAMNLNKDADDEDIIGGVGAELANQEVDSRTRRLLQGNIGSSKTFTSTGKRPSDTENSRMYRNGLGDDGGLSVAQRNRKNEDEGYESPQTDAAASSTTGGGRGGPPRTTPMTNRLIVKAVASVAKAPASEKKEKVKLVKALTKEGSTVRTAASAFPPTEDSQDVYEQVKSVHESL